MARTPAINYSFTIEEALQKFGFRIDDKDSGASVACGVMYKGYGEIFVEFNQSFITNYQTDMRVFYLDSARKQQINLFLGVAPTNYKDFDLLMQLLLPSEEFIGGLGILA